MKWISRWWQEYKKQREEERLCKICKRLQAINYDDRCEELCYLCVREYLIDRKPIPKED